MKLTASDLLQVRHERILSIERIPKSGITGVSTDSRSVKKGDLFVALRGEKFDGHDFLESVVKVGVSALCVGQTWFSLKGGWLAGSTVPTVVVKDTIRAFGELARVYRRKFNIPVLAVGGSNGKTTTKEMIASILRTKYPVLSTEGNLNNHIGVPQTMFRLEKKHKAAVVEVGTNHAGEIAYLCEVLEPTHGLLTNIGHEHLEFFHDLNGVAKAEGELFAWLSKHAKQGGTSAVAFVNADDRRLAKQASRVKKKITYGFRTSGVAVKGNILGFDRHGNGEVEGKPKGGKAFLVKLNVPGEHNAMNALAASAVGIAFKVPVSKIQKALAAFKAISKRMQVLHIAGVTVINDTYNANPDSVLAALWTLGTMKTSGKRIAVLGDMFELGSHSEEAHRSIGQAAGKAGVEYLLTHGANARLIHDAAAVSFKAHYDQKNILSEYLCELLSAGDVVLVKGSRSMKMEDIVTFLQERFQRATP